MQERSVDLIEVGLHHTGGGRNNDVFLVRSSFSRDQAIDESFLERGSVCEGEAADECT